MFCKWAFTTHSLLQHASRFGQEWADNVFAGNQIKCTYVWFGAFKYNDRKLRLFSVKSVIVDAFKISHRSLPLCMCVCVCMCVYATVCYFCSFLNVWLVASEKSQVQTQTCAIKRRNSFVFISGPLTLSFKKHHFHVVLEINSEKYENYNIRALIAIELRNWKEYILSGTRTRTRRGVVLVYFHELWRQLFCTRTALGLLETVESACLTEGRGQEILDSRGSAILRNRQPSRSSIPVGEESLTDRAEDDTCAVCLIQ